MRKFHRARAEWILLGMALAKEGDRERILSEVEEGHLQSELVQACLQAIREQDIATVRRAMKMWTIDVDKSIVEGVLNTVFHYDRYYRG